MSRRRAAAAAALASCAALAAAGCGGGGGDEPAAAPETAGAGAATVPAAVAPVAPGGAVRAGAATPAPVARALAGSGVVVVALVVPAAADDQSVATALRELRAERGVDVFVYRVGRDRFGDLADLLGVTDAPEVAVIGRDRVLTNLWTGLVDAEILRQAVADAADRPAANRAPGGSGPASGMTGAPAGIALARTVNRAAGGLAGVRMRGSLRVEGAGTMRIDAVARVDDGAVTDLAGDVVLAGTRVEMVSGAEASHLRAASASCWARLPSGGLGAAATPPPSVPADARVSAPRRQGALRLLDVMVGTGTATYVVGPGGRVREVRTPVGTVAFEPLTEPPAIPSASPVCDDPTEALEGLPPALGGSA